MFVACKKNPLKKYEYKIVNLSAVKAGRTLEYVPPRLEKMNVKQK